jgi:hypothetical protein
MQITDALVNTLRLKLNQPQGYKIEMTSVILHGKGCVLAYKTTDPHGLVQYRAAGFVTSRKSELGLACTFDMIVSTGE